VARQRAERTAQDAQFPAARRGRHRPWPAYRAVLRRRRVGRAGVRGPAHRRCPDSTRLRRLIDRMGRRPAYAQVAARQRLTGQRPLASLHATVPAQRLATPGLHRTRGLRSGRGRHRLVRCAGMAGLRVRSSPLWLPAAGQIGVITLQNPWSGAGSNRRPSAFQVHSGRWRDSARDRLTGRLAAKTRADCGLRRRGGCRCWLPFGSPFGSPGPRPGCGGLKVFMVALPASVQLRAVTGQANRS
jgi:hypothetical protein